MAQTFREYNAPATYSFTFPSYQESDVKVRVDGVLKTAGTHYNITSYNTTGGGTVVFIDNSGSGGTNHVPSSGVVRIYRDTNVDSAKADYTAGSSVKAADLNNNHKQLLFKAQEEQVPNLIQSYDIDAEAIETSNIKADAIVNSKIADDQIDSEHYVAGSIDLEHMSANSIDSDQYVDGSIDEVHISNSAVSQNKLADNSVGTPELINGSVNSDKILDGTIVNADINASAAIAGTKISPDFGSQNIVTTGTISTGSFTTSGTVDGRDIAADGTKLDTIESNAKDDQTAAEIRALVDSASDSNVFTDADHSKLNGIEASATADQTSTDIKGLLQSDKLTLSEISTTSLDSRYYTETESDARYFNISTGDTIKDGDTFPDNDTTIATTAAINDRIIDLVDDVGGFVPIANETSFPTTNPDINLSGVAKGGTIVSVAAASTALTAQSGTTLTIANGRGTGNAVIITGVTATIPQGFGFLVETTATDHTYAFHRLVPKATEVTTVAGISSNITTVGNNTSNINTVAGIDSNVTTVAGISGNVTTVAGVASNVTTVAGISSDVTAVANDATDIGVVAGKATEIGRLGTADAVADMNTLGTTAIVSDMDTLADISSNISTVAGVASNVTTVAGISSNVTTVANNNSNVTTVAGSISNVNTTAGSISNVNTVASNISSVNNFANQYRIGSTNPTTSLDTGDLFFNTTTDSLKVYTGSAWVDGVTQTGDFALKTGNTFTGSNIYNDNVKAKFGTDSDLQIYHTGSNSFIDESNGVGSLYVRTNACQIQKSAGSETMAQFLSDGAVNLYYDNSKKFETTSIGAKVTATNNGDGFVVTAGEGGAVTVVDQRNAAYKGTFYMGGSAPVIRNHNTSTSDHTLRIQKGTTFIANFDGTGNFQLPIDDQKIQLGASQDLQIYHDGNSIIDNDTNDLIIRCDGDDVKILAQDDIVLRDNDDSTNFIHCVNGGSVDLYYNGSKKLNTKSDGVLVSGELQATTLDINGSSHLDGTAVVTGNVDMPDNAKVLLGTGDDLEIYHDGSHSYIKDVSANQPLRIVTSDLQFWNEAESHLQARIISDAQVELYHDNTKRFETTAGGALITGSLGTTDTLTVGGGGHIKTGTDTGKFFSGASNDLKLYHDGTNSYLENDTGDLIIKAAFPTFQAPNGETILNAGQNGAVNLYYDNSKKLETTSTGVLVQGRYAFDTDNYITCNNTANTLEFVVGDANVAEFSSSALKFPDNKQVALGTGNDLKIYHDGSDSFIKDAGTGGLIINSNAFFVNNAGQTENMIKATENGAVELYYDHTKKLETTADGATISGLLASTGNIQINNDTAKIRLGASQDLELFHDGTNSNIYNASGNLRIRAANNLQLETHDNEMHIKCVEDAQVELYFNNSKKVETTNTGAYVYGDLGFGIGTTGNLFAGDGDKILLGNGNDLQIYHDGTDTYIDNHQGDLFIRGDGDDIFLKAVDTKDSVRCRPNTSVDLFYDDSLKLETASTGIRIHGGSADWSETNPGTTVGSIHLDPNNGNNNFGSAITFGASDSNNGTDAHAGIYTRSDGSYGTKMYFATTSSYANGAYARFYITETGHVLPTVNNAYDLGSSSYRWRNIYTNDLHLSNEGSSNEMDGTWGDWTMQEGESDLFLKNNRSGKKYKFNLTEVS